MTIKKLKVSSSSIAEKYEDVTVLFADIVGFTKLSESRQPEEIVELLDEIFSKFDILTEKYCLEKIKTIGDAYMVVGGIPEKRTDHCIAIANIAIDMNNIIIDEYTTKYKGLKLRIGIQTGPVVAGVVGKKKYAYDIWGNSVNVSSRMESNGEIGKVNISATTFDMVKNEFDCQHRGKIYAKNVGEIDMYFINRLYNIP